MTGNPYIDLAAGGVNLLSNVFGANQQADITREQVEEQKRQREFEERNQVARQKAYETALGRGGEQMGQGENAFMSAVNTAPAELDQAKQDILTGGAKSLQQATGQMKANLASSGVRGGQAATQLRRGIGEMGENTQMDLNKLGLEDAQKRKEQLLAMQATKAQLGQQANLRAPTF